MREQYRAEFLARLDTLTPQRGRAPFQRGKSPLLPRPTTQEARAVGRSGLDPQVGRAILLGLARFPALIGAHAEAVAALPLGNGPAARLRDLMLEAAMTHAALDPDGLATILANQGAGDLLEEPRLKRGLAFSFTRRDAPPERAQRDLVLVVEAYAARPELDAAYEAVTARLKVEFDEAAFAEQVRLRTAREEADRRLASLIVGDGVTE